MKTLFAFALAAMAAVTAYADSTNVTPDEAEKLLKQNKQIVVLDVRTPEEFAQGHLAGAKNLDFHSDDFAKQLDALDKSKPYLVHCAAGGRSAKSMATFKKLNFQVIYHMDAGFNGWKEAGKPVEK